MVRTVAGLLAGTRVSDHVTLGVLTTTVPASLIDAVLVDTGREGVRRRALPARLVVYPGRTKEQSGSKALSLRPGGRTG